MFSLIICIFYHSVQSFSPKTHAYYKLRSIIYYVNQHPASQRHSSLGHSRRVRRSRRGPRARRLSHPRGPVRRAEPVHPQGRDAPPRRGATARSAPASTAATTARSPRSSAFPSVRSARSSTARAYENAVRAGERRQGLGQNSPASRPRPHFLCIFPPNML